MISKKQVMQALDKVIDPEIGVSIVRMGLMKKIEVKKDEVKVRMMLTSPFCPFTDYLVQQAKNAVEGVSGVRKAVIETIMPKLKGMK